MAYFFYKKGITVIELLVVVAILGIVVLVVLPQFSRIKENQVLKSAVGDVISILDKARSQTLASLNSSEYGVRFESGRVIIFKGQTFTSGAAGNETISIISPASISNVTLGGASGVSGEMYFNRLSGSPSKNGTVTISVSSISKIITISATGVASMD